MNSPTFVCFDLNGTLITNDTWRDLNYALGVLPSEDQDIMRLWAHGECSYEVCQKKLEFIYKKRGRATKQNITQILSIYDYAKGAKEIINYLQGKKYTIGLISNSIDMLVENVARDLHIPLYAANNSFIFNGKDEIQEIKVSDNDTQFKQERVSRWCKELSVDMAHCIYVGDANDDRELFLASGHGITFKGSLLEPIAWKTIDTLLDIQNIL
jgi:HAD superfamily phosphoserine phosphatase-like hydrolase